MTMFGPIPRMTWGHMQIYGLYYCRHRLRGYNHWLRIYNRRRGRIANLHLSVGAGGDFTAYREIDDRLPCTGR